MATKGSNQTNSPHWKAQPLNPAATAYAEMRTRAVQAKSDAADLRVTTIRFSAGLHSRVLEFCAAWEKKFRVPLTFADAVRMATESFIEDSDVLKDTSADDLAKSRKAASR